jgi:hypothetical protein
MAKHRIQNHYRHLPFPRPPPTWCAPEEEIIASHLLKDHKAKKWQVVYLTSMLSESYISSLPRLKRDSSGIGDSSPERLRWLWLIWAAKILEWRNERFKGHPCGFNAQVFDALRQKVYPFPKLEHTNDGQPLQSCALACTSTKLTMQVTCTSLLSCRAAAL